MQTEPTSFLRFTADVAANELLSFGVGALCAAGYYFFAKKSNSQNLWRNTGVVYTITAVATTGARVLLNSTNSTTNSLQS